MRKNFYTIFFLALLISCQKEFNFPEQAENEVTKKGLKDGRWVEYILSDRDIISGEIELSNDTIDNKNYIGYRLIEYEDGYPKGEIREFYKSDAKCTYFATFNEPARLDKFPKENYIDTIYFENQNFKRKSFYYVDSLYLENHFLNSNGQLSKKNLTILYRKIPSERQKLLNEIDWKFIEKKMPNEFNEFNNLPKIALFYKNQIEITYFSEGKIDTTMSSLSSLDEYLLNIKNEISILKSKSFGKLKNCKCCGKSYYQKTGWQFYEGRAEKYQNLGDSVEKLWAQTLGTVFGTMESYYIYCSMKCASQCGPYE